jgi:beta-lactamase class A
MADAIAKTVPADTPAYGKGGSIDWERFHCLCFAGQMIVSKVPVTFCLTINWNGPDDKVPAMMQAYIAGAADVLRETAQAVG